MLSNSVQPSKALNSEPVQGHHSLHFSHNQSANLNAAAAAVAATADAAVAPEFVEMGIATFYSGDWQIFVDWFKDYALEFKDRAVAAFKQELTSSILNIITSLQAPVDRITTALNSPSEPTPTGISALENQIMTKYGVTSADQFPTLSTPGPDGWSFYMAYALQIIR